MYNEDPKQRLVRAEAILLETISRLVWIVAIFYAIQLLFGFYWTYTTGEFTIWEMGTFTTIITVIIIFAILLSVFRLIDKHLMEYWKRVDERIKRAK